MKSLSSLIHSLVLLAFTGILRADEETLPPITDGKAPQTYEEMWAGFDPRKEPLDVEVLHEWEQDEVILKVIRYRIGVFKGKKAMMGAVYGYPKGAKNLPGLLNIHGGGQYADSNSVFTNAKRGYATISIGWAGRINAPHYRVSPNEVALFWENKTDNPAYKLTTDWGALDAYHAPSRNGKDAFVSIPSGEEWTLDPVESPRNNSWFLCTLGARRALTFLEQQPEVDGDKLGVYGHSMGGKLTVATTAADKRIKAAAPSCGGISDRYNDKELHRNTIGDGTALMQIDCPVIFLNPSNDFHGHINSLVDAVKDLGSNEWRATCSPHISHRDAPEYEVATQLWFDQHLKSEFQFPKTPETELTFDAQGGAPTFSVTPDASKPIVGVEVYYTQQGNNSGDRSLRENRINRFWHHAAATASGEKWTARLPISDAEKPLWVYANVLYALDQPISGAGYYYGNYTTKTFNLSSLVELVSAKALQEKNVTPTLKPSLEIESFEGDWKKQWFTHKADTWEIRTHKVYHPLWAAPEGANLAVAVKSEKPNNLVVGVDKFATEVPLKGGPEWQAITITPSDLKDAEGNALKNWAGIKELRFLPAEHLRGKKGEKPKLMGGTWSGGDPDFHKLRWVK